MTPIVNARQHCASSQNDAFCSSRACRGPDACRDQPNLPLIKDTTMASFFLVNPIRRSLMVAAVLGAVVLPGPLSLARAETPARTSEHHGRPARHMETVEQRIANLHAALKITPEEELNWQAVAQTIRDNAAALQKLASEKAGQMRQGVTAVEDLQTYLQFAQAHVD